MKKIYAVLCLMTLCFLGTTTQECMAAQSSGMHSINNDKKIMFPTYFGSEIAPSLILVHWLPDSPNSKELWHELTSVMKQLNPDDVRIVVQGRSKDKDKRFIMLSGTFFAIKNPELGVKYLTEIYEDTSGEPFKDAKKWTEEWAKKNNLYEDGMIGTIDYLYSDAVTGANNIYFHYILKRRNTTAIIVNNTVLPEDQNTAAGILNALKNTKPFSEVPLM